MAINMLNLLGIRSVHLAGFDGFGEHNDENYIDANMVNLRSETENHLLTETIGQELSRLSESMEINFVTTSQYDMASTDRIGIRDAA